MGDGRRRERAEAGAAIGWASGRQQAVERRWVEEQVCSEEEESRVTIELARPVALVVQRLLSVVVAPGVSGGSFELQLALTRCRGPILGSGGS